MIRLLFLFGISLFLLSSFFAQVPPNAINYSAVARNISGQTIVSKIISVKVEILKGSNKGNVELLEFHIVETDPFGLFNILIGAGQNQVGKFDSIIWNSNNYFLKLSVDIDGGMNFSEIGVTQFFSVPYSLHSKTAERLVSGGGGSFNHYVGEKYGGGVIFHLWKENGIERGLIVDVKDLSDSFVWSNLDNNIVGALAQSNWDGLNNSKEIVQQPGHIMSAAELCLNSMNGGFDDWYLPSIDELNILWRNRFSINKALSTIINSVELPYFASYWSSSENDSTSAWSLYFYNGNSGSIGGQGAKFLKLYVRAIRSF